jgi:hypothetical protein
VDYDSVPECQAVLEEFTSRYARTDETHDAALFEAQVPEASAAAARAGSRWARSSISAPNIPRHGRNRRRP